MKAEILSIGTEILLGEIVDTNAAYIASRLPALGIDLYFKAVVGDNMERLTETIGRARERSDVVICTGGLGPTEDDLTREAICAVLGEEPHVDPELEATLRGFFERRGYAMPERNVKQCWLIPSARAIPNPRGTAPGWWVERDGKIIIAMPGPPTEMTRMWENEVAPELLRRNPGSVLITRTLKTAGIGEGTVDEMVSPLLKSTNPSIGIYARADGVHLRLAAKAPDEQAAWRLLQPLEAEMPRDPRSGHLGRGRGHVRKRRRRHDEGAPPDAGDDGVVHRRPAREHDHRRAGVVRVLRGAASSRTRRR